MRDRSVAVAPREDAQLAREAQLLTRYLLDRDCPPEMSERYVRGHHARLGHFAVGDSRVCDFAFSRPWSIPYLDAASAILSSASALRGKLLLMSAVLEASPVFAEEFLPRHAPRSSTVLQVAGFGLVAITKLVIGIPLALAVRGRRR